MTLNGWFQILLFLSAIALVTPPLGSYMTRVFTGRRLLLDPVLGPCERWLYRCVRVDAAHGMRWTEYASSLLLFSAVSWTALYVLQRLQGVLPFNPQHLGAVADQCVERGGGLVEVEGRDDLPEQDALLEAGAVLGQGVDHRGVNAAQAWADDDIVGIHQFRPDNLGLFLDHSGQLGRDVPGHQIASGNASCCEVVPLPMIQ